MSRYMLLLSCNKNVDLPGFLACHATSFECLRHILVSLQQATSLAEYDVKTLFFINIAQVSVFNRAVSETSQTGP